jgi:hypothetical protein
MNFEINNISEFSNNELIYYRDEHSFSVEGERLDSYTSLLINDIQLQMDEDGNLLYVDGYCPLVHKKPIDIRPANIIKAKIRFKEINKLDAGISKRINDEERWSIYENDEWICIGNPNNQDSFIEFANGCVLGFLNNTIVSIWLKPKFID